MDESLTFRLQMEVNGRPCALDVSYSALLLDVLRDQLSLTGTKRSCDMEVCGACTVLVDGLPVSACSTLAWEARGKRVETVESLAAGGAYHPLQQAFIEKFALQCGFCTPGMLMSAKSLLDAVPSPSEEQIREHLRGNVCRCTGYRAIVEAVQAAASKMHPAGGESDD